MKVQNYFVNIKILFSCLSPIDVQENFDKLSYFIAFFTLIKYLFYIQGLVKINIAFPFHFC